MTAIGKFTGGFNLHTLDHSNHRENSKELAHELNIRPEMLYRWRTGFAVL